MVSIYWLTAPRPEKSSQRSGISPNLPSSFELTMRNYPLGAGERLEPLTFLSKYNYSRSVAGIEVPISLRVDHVRSVRLLAKVDTGASFCIFQRNYAEQLGIDVESGVRQTVRTPTGRFEVYGHILKLSCLDWEFETTVYFAATLDYSRNVVGRSGWLQNFRLALVDHDSMLFLSHYDD
jgi:hypothetical protein